MKKSKGATRVGISSSAFKKLQNEWYAKLRESGFADIEKDERNVRQYSSNAYRQASLLERTTKLAYYTAMEHQAERYSFTSAEQRYVILRASEGAFISEIVKELKARSMSLHKHTVIRIIRRFEHETGIREWTAKQRHQKK